MMICTVVAIVGSTGSAQTWVEPGAPVPLAAVQQELAGAIAALQSGAPELALEQADRALNVARELSDGLGEGLSYAWRAHSLRELGRRKEAADAMTMAASRLTGPACVPERVQMLTAAALLLLDLANAPAAEDLLEQSLSIGRRDTVRPLATAEKLHSASLIMLNKPGQLRYARRFSAAAVALKAKYDTSSPATAEMYNTAGRMAAEQGDIPNALDHFQRALNLRTPGTLGHAQGLNNLGAMAKQQGEMDAARRYFMQALEIHERLAPDDAPVVTLLNNLGRLAHEQGDLHAARDYFERAMIRTQSVDSYAPLAFSNVLTNLGGVLLDQQQLDAARDHFQRALDIRMAEAPDSLDVASSLNHLGLVAYYQQAEDRRRNLLKAQHLFKTALDLRNSLAPGSWRVVASLNNLGLAAHDLGDLASARDYYQKSLTLIERLAPRSLDKAKTLVNLGLVARQQRNLVEAEDLTRQAWLLVRAHAARVVGDEAQLAFGSSSVPYAATLVEARLALNRIGPAFLALEEGRAQALERMLLERDAVANTKSGELVAAYGRALVSRDRAEAAIAESSTAAERAERALAESTSDRADASQLTELRAVAEASKRNLSDAQQALVRARTEAEYRLSNLRRDTRLAPSPMSLNQAHALLSSDALYLAFSVGTSHTTLFLVGGQKHASRVAVASIRLSATELSAAVREYVDQVSNPRSPLPKIVAGGRELFAKLFPEPIRPLMLTARRLLISPDGPLWELPFAALVVNDEDPPTFMGIVKELSYTPSLAVLSQVEGGTPTPSGARLEALVVGDPVFSRVSSAPVNDSRFRGERSSLFSDDKPPPPLPASKVEAEEIATLYRSDALTHERATEEAVRGGIEHADVIHLATHGYLHPRRAMTSGLLLTAPAEQPARGDTRDDGVLQAWEIVNQLTLRAELVVLSACETGRGEIVRHEGIVGLSRAFQSAGAKAVIASQWKVGDPSTSTLMVAFHRSVRQGLRKDEALRRAMTQVQANVDTAHPFHWAPFLLLGSRHAVVAPEAR